MHVIFISLFENEPSSDGDSLLLYKFFKLVVVGIRSRFSVDNHSSDELTQVDIKFWSQKWRGDVRGKKVDGELAMC